MKITEQERKMKLITFEFRDSEADTWVEHYQYQFYIPNKFVEEFDKIKDFIFHSQQYAEMPADPYNYLTLFIFKNDTV